MKKITLSLMLLMVLMIVPTIALATEEMTVKIGETEYTTLNEAIKNANSGDTITLIKNVSLNETVTVLTGSKYTINLNGYNITGENKLFDVKGAEFTVTGTGTLEETSPFYAPIYVSGDAVADTVVNLGSNVTLKGWSGVMISADAASAKSIEINCDSKIQAVNDTAGGTGIGIYINGGLQDTNNCPVINLSSTTNVSATGNAIYAAGYANWNINGSSFEGIESGLAIKSGRFNIENATVLSTGEDKTPTDGYNNGVYPSGAAIQIESNDSYYGGIYLNIKDGTFTSQNGSSVYEYLAVNDELGINTLNTYVKELNIENGNFVSAKDSVKVSSDLKNKITKFIKSGTFNSVIYTNYLAENANITVNLDNDAELYETITIPTGSKYTINLNGHNITGENKLFDVKGAEFTVTGTGTIEETSPFYAPIYVSGDAAADTVVNLGSNVTLKGWSGVMISADAASSKSIEINCDSKIQAVNDTAGGTGIGIYINGGLQDTNNCPVINLSSTTNVSATGNAIYAAGYANWNINGSSFEGIESGLAIKSGRFNIENATVLATGEDQTPTDGYNNGVYPSGAAIQIESNDSYYGGIYLNIKNGTFTSNQGNGLYEYLAVNEELGIDTQNTYVKELNIENGNFVAAKDTIKVSSDFKTKITKFIKGGTYSTDVTEYLADGYVYKNNTVLKENTITSITTNGMVSVNKLFGILGDTITITPTPDEGFEVGSIIVKDANGNEITVTDNSFVMPDSEVTVEVVFKEFTQETNIPSQVVNTEEVKEILLDALKGNEEFAELIKNNNVEVNVELKEVELDETNKEKIQEKLDTKAENIKVVKYLDITIVVKAGETEKNLAELGEEITFVITLPEMPELQEGYKRNYYIVREHNGELEFIDAKENEGRLEFSSSKFSTYAIAYSDVKDKSNDGGPEGGIPDGTEPDGTAPDGTEPDGTEPDGTEPDGTEPDGTEPDGTEPDGTEPDGTEPDGTEPDGTEPEESKPQGTKPEETKPSINVPMTGDNIVVYVVIAIASLLGIMVLKKSNHKKSKH